MSNTDATQRAGTRGQKVGVIDEYMGIFTIKPGQADKLREKAYEYCNSELRQSAQSDSDAVRSGIHDLRLTVIDNDTKLVFATTFDTEWEPYVADSIDIMTGVWPWGQFIQYTEEAPEGIEIKGKIGTAETLALLEKVRVTAAGYTNTFPNLTVRNIQNMQRVYDAFQKVLDSPQAAEALSHPALKPLLDEASN